MGGVSLGWANTQELDRRNSVGHLAPLLICAGIQQQAGSTQIGRGWNYLGCSCRIPSEHHSTFLRAELAHGTTSGVLATDAQFFKGSVQL